MKFTKKEALEILKKEAPKYKSFRDFRTNHPNGYCIERMTRRVNMNLRYIYSLFGGKKCVMLTKKQWAKYLSKNYSKYPSLDSFIRKDPKGGTLKYQLYVLKNIDSSWVISSYWKNKAELRELKIVHPAFDKILKKKKIDFEKEVWISKKSRVDRVLTLKNGKKILVELKADESCHTLKSISNQKSRYHKTAKSKFKKDYCMTYVVSPKGEYGLSFKEFLIDIERFIK